MNRQASAIRTRLLQASRYLGRSWYRRTITKSLLVGLVGAAVYSVALGAGLFVVWLLGSAQFVYLHRDEYRRKTWRSSKTPHEAAFSFAFALLGVALAIWALTSSQG